MASLEELSEDELLEMLLQLENEDESATGEDLDTNLLENFDNVEDLISEDELLETDINESIMSKQSGGSQFQEQSQSVIANIHSHNHYYLIQVAITIYLVK